MRPSGENMSSTPHKYCRGNIWLGRGNISLCRGIAGYRRGNIWACRASWLDAGGAVSGETSACSDNAGGAGTPASAATKAADAKHASLNSAWALANSAASSLSASGSNWPWLSMRRYFRLRIAASTRRSCPWRGGHKHKPSAQPPSVPGDATFVIRAIRPSPIPKPAAFPDASRASRRAPSQ